MKAIAGGGRTIDRQPLIHLSSEQSSIKLSEGASLNIENNRRRTPGPLISMEGTLEFFPDGNKLALEDSAGNTVSFPRIYQASIGFVQDNKNTIALDANSSRAHSDNSHFHGQDLTSFLATHSLSSFKKYPYPLLLVSINQQ
ncbi:hypothetical protein [Aerococcus sp. HMSC10H05]|uniref:hypothetical protein n=1 Tax=Aerococcus sp. HMSC10H05 TaxID=1581084 RepID=UPI0008A34140|nr:hypothetical protein [Aerococcus sp. HMSC10H05]OFU50118.1 hypothetical protein HMPREF3116_05840 [Aerococcus sp. HMSC10H05]